MRTVLFIALGSLLIIDWRQTLVIAQPGGWFERNPALAWLIARFGAAGVHVWFALWSVILAASIYYFPQYALWIAGIACAIEAACVINNWRLGIKP